MPAVCHRRPRPLSRPTGPLLRSSTPSSRAPAESTAPPKAAVSDLLRIYPRKDPRRPGPAVDVFWTTIPTSTMSAPPRFFQFGPYVLDPPRHLLFKRGVSVALTPKAFEILTVLVRRAGEVVTREELLAECWPGYIVQEANLTNHVFTLRQALGDKIGAHRYIVTVPGRGYKFVAEVGQSSASEDERLGKPDRRPEAAHSIAVLPFRLLGGEVRDEYLATGLPNAIVTRLSRIRNVLVRPPSAVERTPLNPRAEGRRLRADVVLAGTLHRVGRNLRVNVELLRVRDGVVVWAGQFDERRGNLFKVEHSIAERVITELLTTLSRDEEQQLTQRPTTNNSAYHAYLRGRFLWNKRTEDSIKIAIEYFEQAIEHDPHYALAHVGLADCYNLLTVLSAMPPADGASRARAAAQRALALDPTLPDAQVSLGYASLNTWDWSSAEQWFREALNGNPLYATAHQWYAEYLTAVDRLPEAIAEYEKAHELDPVSLVIHANLGHVYYFARQYAVGAGHLRRTLELDPYFLLSHWFLGLNHEQQGSYDDALAPFGEAMRLSHGSPLVRASRARTLALSGRRAEARAELKMLEDAGRHRYVSPYGIALVHAALGSNRVALQWLRKAFAERSNWLVFAKVDPRLDSLREEAAVKTIVRELQLP
ncbi:MAG: winged helix-turn-helix domain-containing protein [Vicinamibacterales bacterium]